MKFWRLTMFMGCSLVAWCSLSPGSWAEREQHLWPGMKTGTPLTDAQFFASVNLDLPGLQEVKARVAAADWKAARDQFYRYLRDKFRKAKYYSLPEITNGEVSLSDSWLNDDLLNFWIEEGRKIHKLGDDEKNLLAIADDFAVKGRVIFHSTGRIYQFDPSKPFNYADYDPHDREYHESIQMYAMYDVALLRYAYFKTSKQIYAERAEQMMRSYCDWYGGGAAGPWGNESHRAEGNPTPPWENWTLPRRLEGYVRFFTFLQKADMDPDLVIAVMKEVLQDEQLHVDRKWGRSNWVQYMSTDGSLIAAVFFEFKEASQWWEHEMKQIFEGTDLIYPDGSTEDLSPSYGEAYVHWMEPISHAIRTFDSPVKINVPPEVAARYEALFDWEFAMRKPDGRDIQVSDTGASRPPQWYGRMAGNLFGYFGRADMRWFASEGKDGHPPSQSSFPATSTTASYAGFYVMRSDWSKQALYFVSHFGPSAAGHGHPDYGSFILSAYGADLIDEGGCASYGSEAYEKYSSQAWAHNIVGIDGFSQRRHAWSEADGLPPRGQPQYQWITNSAYDYTWGSYPFGGVSAELKGIHWDRAIYFVKPDYFVLLDRIRGEGTHKIRSKMQLSWDVSAEVEGTGVAAQSGQGASLKIAPFDSRTAPHIIRGQKDPFWDGWISKIPHSNLVEVAPAVVYEETRGLPVAQETLLYPARGGEKLDVRLSRIAADEGEAGGVLLTVQTGKGSSEDKIVVSDGSVPVKFNAQGIAVQGQLVHLRYQGNALNRIAFVKTSSISMPLGGKPARIQFERPTDGYLKVGAGGRFERMYLDLSNRQQQATVVIETTGTSPVRVIVPVGKETSF
jgi:hypothetical protein